MHVVVTGGGTGGHVYPALEVARLAQERKAQITYMGSIRGQEGDACRQRGIEFLGFPSQPLYSLRTLRGIKGLAALLRARGMAKAALRHVHPDVVFSTGGYSAGPVVSAARSLGIPYTIHSADSVPARSSLIYARQAAVLTCTFKRTQRYVEGVKVVRTGQPIRRELREAAGELGFDAGKPALVLVVGGSQGSEFLNRAVPEAAARLGKPVKFVHASGRANYERLAERIGVLGPEATYRVEPYLETAQLVEAYRAATLVIARSGGTLAELALFGLPSLLVPLPSAAANHQHHNAEEFVEMDAATILDQPDENDDLGPFVERMAREIVRWTGDDSLRSRAYQNLREWDQPDATERIVQFIEKAARFEIVAP